MCSYMHISPLSGVGCIQYVRSVPHMLPSNLLSSLFYCLSALLIWLIFKTYWERLIENSLHLVYTEVPTHKCTCLWPLAKIWFGTWPIAISFVSLVSQLLTSKRYVKNEISCLIRPSHANQQVALPSAFPQTHCN